ncbi:hypothetical protein [Antarcticirhabdus aurantiaca]|uniref:Uncharacterized protein n=1 Tax=Antarcticirhabdus aurantiaca TaxID=2606717 RepID=A0ACD4NQX9_9HYPH|nr:hypothetical protein OXU80_03595 [Jeongeuplla avenae]
MNLKIALVALPLAALAISASASAQEIRDITPEERAKVEAAVRKKLLDPDSAQFQDVRASVSDSGLITVCGKVNAKNQYGGYSGRKLFHTFIAKDDNDSSREMIAPTVDDEGMVPLAEPLCRQAKLLD